ncbi:ABC transporter permease subunit [Mesobacillus foraminis]|uniref:ABC transporter permease subunit n=1 Tax=Mesobacillus foraminis TaxID=279826 RepID=UPI001BE9B2F6|nr:ABC transporter permease subunit [Mesobacillus foraminis]MBT2755338.1 ABC transporter permease subunit [Mesobacillus foraminis]
MSKHIIKAIVEKDIRATFSSKKIWVPMFILVIVLCMIVPAITAYCGLYTGVFNNPAEDIEKPINSVIQSFPDEAMREKLAALPTLGSKFVYYFMNFMLIPFFLMVTIINSMVIASNSFAGEKERNTLETLLFAPVSIKELFVAKVIAAFIPTIALTFGAFIVNILVLNFISYSIIRELLFLNVTWLLLMFWVIPALVLFNIILSVLVSAKVKSFQEAQQFGGIMVLPIVGIIISQASGLFFLSPLILFLIGVGLLLGNILLLKWVTKFNSRNNLFESQIH